MPVVVNSLSTAFRRTSSVVSWLAGHHFTFAVLVAATIGWTLFGLKSGFRVEWFLMSNTLGTVGSFLILVMLQHSKRRETLAIQTKLDQLIFASDAKNDWIGAQRHEADVIDDMRLKHHGKR